MDQVKRIAIAVIAMLAAFVAAPARQGSAQSSEWDVKAAFLLNFTKFVEWPPSAFEDSRSPFTICILGRDPFDRTLDQLVEGESVNGRQVVVQRIRFSPKPKACQILYVGDGEKDVADMLHTLGPGLLTVSDRPGFLRDGGIIVFTVQDRHVRFDINRHAAADAVLTVSARLLNVARSVR